MNNRAIENTVVKGQVPLLFPVADQVADLVADLRVRVVCVSQTGRKLVESQLRTCLRPGLSYLEVENQVCDLDSVMEFGLYRVGLQALGMSN